MVHFTDSNIKESSGAAYDFNDPSVFYTMNDENGPIYTVDRTTGATVGKFGVNFALNDPEALATNRQGNLFLLDGGNDGSHGTDNLFALYWRSAPGRGYPGTLSWNRATFEFADGSPRNLEGFCINGADSSKRFFISKTNPSKVFAMDPGDTLTNGGHYEIDQVATGLGSYISDMCISPDGNFAMARRMDQNDKVYLYETDDWTELGPSPFTVPSMSKPEGIAINWAQTKYLITSEGQFSTFYERDLPDYLKPGPDFSPCG